jgi:hypothetical protein
VHKKQRSRDVVAVAGEVETEEVAEELKHCQ